MAGGQSAFAKAEARAKKLTASKAAMDREILTQLLRASQGGQKVVHKMARVRKRTYPPEFAYLDTLPKILWCQCQKILDDQGQRVQVPRDECSCAARDWVQTSLLVDADALQVLEDVRDAEEQLVGVRMPLQSYMLAAFTGYLPTRQEGLEQAELVRQTLASGQKPPSPKTLRRKIRWPQDVAQTCHQEAKRIYVSGRGKQQVFVPSSWFYSLAIRRFAQARMKLLES